MRIVHISDSHISLAQPDRANDLQACVDLINASAEQVDAVVHTGDVAHEAAAEEYTIAKQCLEQLQAPYFVMVGNKDKREAMSDAFLDNKRMQLHSGFVQYMIDRFPVRLIMLDTLSEASNKGRFCQARLKHLQAMLESDDKPVSLFMHHSPFEVSAIPDPYQFEDWSEVDALADMLNNYDHVTGIYCGHIHRTIMGRLNGLQVSAISCMATDLRKGKMSDAERAAPMVMTHILGSS